MKLGLITAIALSFGTTAYAGGDEECVVIINGDCISATQLESALSRLKALYELRASAAENSPNGLGSRFLRECAEAANNYNTYITQEMADNHPNWETSVDPNRCYASKDDDSGFFYHKIDDKSSYTRLLLPYIGRKHFLL